MEICVKHFRCCQLSNSEIWRRKWTEIWPKSRKNSRTFAPDSLSRKILQKKENKISFWCWKKILRSQKIHFSLTALFIKTARKNVHSKTYRTFDWILGSIDGNRTVFNSNSQKIQNGFGRGGRSSYSPTPPSSQGHYRLKYISRYALPKLPKCDDFLHNRWLKVSLYDLKSLLLTKNTEPLIKRLFFRVRQFFF